MTGSWNPPAPRLEADVAIVGAGFAGAATAYHLARRGQGRVVLLEKETFPGMHSSGRNAAMIRQVNPDASIAAMAREGAEFVRRLDAELESGGAPGLFRRSGSVLLARRERSAALRAEAQAASGGGVETEMWDAPAACRRFPILERSELETACFTASDGVVDIARLLRHYLDEARRAGARLLLESPVLEVMTSGGRIAGLRTPHSEIRAPIVVNAAGAWAGALAGLAGAAPMPLRPRRRHLFASSPLGQVDRSWPYFWDLSAEIYFRPESGGALVSPCDEGEPAARLESGDIQPEAFEMLERKLSRHYPELAHFPVRAGWSGLRTLTGDGRFIIGPDPILEGFFWVAGLGGHGVTTSSAVGNLAAGWILEPQSGLRNPHHPGRFVRQAASRPFEKTLFP